MTRKDYIRIAEALRIARESGGLDVTGVAEFIGNALYNDNPRFDREYFLAIVRGERELTSRPPHQKVEV